MIIKNGKRMDGMGDSMPIGSIIEYNGTDIPDGWELVEEPDTELNLITDGDPIKAGYKIDGRDVYVKRVFVPSLPNNGLLEPDTGIPSTYDIDYYVGTVINNNRYTMTVPVEGTNFMRAALDGRSTNYVIQISTNSDRTTWKGYFNIYYY